MIKNKLEVIVNKLNDLETVNQTDVNQIEFCVDLKNDGLSPLVEDVVQMSRKTSKKIRVMLRNHYDNFQIKESQLRKIIAFMEKTNNLNIDGYVFGAINKQKEINYEALEEVIKHLKDKTLTFHKAFDLVDKKHFHLEKLLKYRPVKFILTSGGQGNPLDNMSFFKNIPSKYKKNILLGGGVNLEVIRMMKLLQFHNFHIGKAARKDKNYQLELDLKSIQKYIAVLHK